MLDKLARFIRHIIPARFRPIGYLCFLAWDKSHHRVVGGPFAGMEYIRTSHGSAYIPKILGIYEKELALFVEAACAAQPDLIVDIGAAEGYYAVGLARRNPQARVVAFEADQDARLLLSEMIDRNGLIQQVEIRGLAGPSDLSSVLADAVNPLVVCDVEGHEAALLDPAQVAGLHRASILVELHDFIVRDIGREIEKRFESTHRVTWVQQMPRSREEFPYQNIITRLLPKSYLDWSVSEWRPERMSWLWMVPRSGGPSGESEHITK